MSCQLWFISKLNPELKISRKISPFLSHEITASYVLSNEVLGCGVESESGLSNTQVRANSISGNNPNPKKLLNRQMLLRRFYVPLLGYGSSGLFPHKPKWQTGSDMQLSTAPPPLSGSCMGPWCWLWWIKPMEPPVLAGQTEGLLWLQPGPAWA